ncbi:MAG: LPXTG cell wall anchor domain-containing protein [Limosilactobacillus sp.]|uniref:LPXTG cell wall anchor domain-containing protein n=1 Tax=Limosilactobacillus sp. TaxID=2773925 RepID=UPI0027058918|nr:LPXTG cell wall anchor domain-containing protein [Limosilactobacillus sp.]
MKERQRWLLRKTTLGLASVFFGTFTYSVLNNQSVKADTQDQSQASEVDQNSQQAVNAQSIQSNQVVLADTNATTQSTSPITNVRVREYQGNPYLSFTSTTKLSEGDKLILDFTYNNNHEVYTMTVGKSVGNLAHFTFDGMSEDEVPDVFKSDHTTNVEQDDGSTKEVKYNNPDDAMPAIRLNVSSANASSAFYLDRSVTGDDLTVKIGSTVDGNTVSPEDGSSVSFTPNVQKKALAEELAKENSTKASDAYTKADDDKKTAYETALANGKSVFNNSSSTQDEVNAATTQLQTALADLNGSSTTQVNKENLAAEIAKESTVKAGANYYNASDAKKQAYDDALASAKTVNSNESATQTEVDNATTALQNATSALDGTATDKTNLAAEIAKDPTVKEGSSYYNASAASKKTYDDALAAAQNVNNDGNATQTAVDNATQTLKNAAAALDGTATDKSALQTAINNDATVKADPKYYNATDEKKQAYESALEAAKAANTKADATQADVNNATTALQNAASALDGTATDKSALQTAIQNDSTVKAGSSYYNATETAKKAYDDALTAAQNVNNDANATQTEVDNATSALNSAASALDGKATDKTNLQTELAKEDATKATDAYKNASAEAKKAYDDALANGQTVNANTAASQSDVDSATQALKTALAGLDGKATPEASDKTALQAELAKEDATKATDAYKNASAEAKKAYDDALANGQTVNGNTAASQSDVDAAVLKLQSTLQNLDGQAPEQTSTSASNSSSTAQTTTSTATTAQTGEKVAQTASQPAATATNKTSNKNTTLPQTGSETSFGVMALGLLLAMYGLTGLKKRN